LSDRYLVADDNQPTRALICEFLRTLEVEFEEAPNGKEAITLLQEQPFDGLFLDLLMPESDGFEVLSWLLKARTGHPVVVFTESRARYDIDFPQMAVELGALKSYDKPITLEKVRDALEVMRAFNRTRG